MKLKHPSSVEIHCRLCRIYDVSVVISLRIVEQWHKKFAEGHTSFDDTSQSGRPSETIDEMVHGVHALLEEDCCSTITNLQVQMTAWYARDASHGAILCESTRIFQWKARK